MRALDMDWFMADEESASGLAAGWDTCPTCGGLGYVESALFQTEYVVGCLDPECGRRYVAVVMAS